MSYRILSLDGGGIRGVLTAKLLERLEAQSPFLQRVDLFAGTSTGGILALGLAKGLSPAALVDLYQNNAKRIFGKRGVLDTLSLGADRLFRADFGTEGLRSVLEETFDDTKLRDLPKTVLIPTYDLEAPEAPGRPQQWKPKFLHNFPRSGNDGDVSCVDAALRSSAAPTYFPSYQGYIDGGVVANDPSACAIAAAVKGKKDLDKIRLLSVGTGFYPDSIEGEKHDWGKVKWGVRILHLVLEGMLGVAGYQCQQLLGDRFHRLQVDLKQRMDLADVSKIKRLLERAEDHDLSEAVAFVNEDGASEPGVA